MRPELTTPTAADLSAVIHTLAGWQREGIPVQLHPGDLGWRWRFGADDLATVLRIWTLDGTAVAIGLVDGPSLVRMAVAPSIADDAAVAAAIVADLEDPARGVVDGATISVEARFGAALRRRLTRTGWTAGEAWTPLVHDLDARVVDRSLWVVVAGPDEVGDRVSVQRAAFDTSTFTSDRWREMATSPAYAQARCLIGYDDEGRPVAAVTVWSAGVGRPGLLEPMGVHRDHRERGYGRAISRAAAAELSALGASSAIVATPATNVGGIATYVAAGFRRLPDVPDLTLAR